MNKIISVVAMCAGSFLLGGSLGLALSSYSCKLCMTEGDLERIKDKIVEELTEDELIELAYNENIERDLKEDPQDRIHYNRETGEYEPFEADEEVISTVEDLVQSYISENDEKPHDATDDDGPFIVSVDSFQNEYETHSKNTLTYYEADNVLTDDRDEVITDPDEYVGPDALDSFGEGSDDENVVYVRNLKKEADYEVIRDERAYQEVILGYQDDEAYNKARKFFNLDKEESEE